MVKSLFRFGQVLLNLTCMFAAHHQKIFVPWFFKVFIDHLQMNLITLSLEKEIIVLEKSLGKVLNFRSKNLYETWALLLYNTHFESLGQPTQSITLPEIAVRSSTVLYYGKCSINYHGKKIKFLVGQ